MLKLNMPGTLFGGLYDPEPIEQIKKVVSPKLRLSSLRRKKFPRSLSLEKAPFGEVEAKRSLVYQKVIFTIRDPFNQHLKVNVKGTSHIRVGELDILLIGRPVSANDPELFRHYGIEPATKKIIGFKAKNHFRAAFEPLVGAIIYVDAPGVASNRQRFVSGIEEPKSQFRPLDFGDYSAVICRKWLTH